ncbi:MAG: BlaI/MecI/CopY family transcriptional regulator [Armatimonadota bacterium]
MRRASLGEQELAVLRYIAEHAPVAARDVVEKFAGEQELSRSTILTKIERLLKKGYLTRRRRGGIFYYSPRVAQSEVVGSLVRDFVEKTLGGSVSPMVAYLLNTRSLSPEDAAVLQRLAAELDDSAAPEDEEAADA